MFVVLIMLLLLLLLAIQDPIGNAYKLPRKVVTSRPQLGNNHQDEKKMKQSKWMNEVSV